MLVVVCILSGALITRSVRAQEEDPYFWLEEVEGEKALEWVESKNKVSLDVLQTYPDFEAVYQKNIEIYNSDERIPYPRFRGAYLYNFWKDEKNERGLWRRTTLGEYRREVPSWEVVLDLDSLARAEDEDWIWESASWLYPGYNRCVVYLSRGSADAVVMREFDLETK